MRQCAAFRLASTASSLKLVCCELWPLAPSLKIHNYKKPIMGLLKSSSKADCTLCFCSLRTTFAENFIKIGKGHMEPPAFLLACVIILRWIYTVATNHQDIEQYLPEYWIFLSFFIFVKKLINYAWGTLQLFFLLEYLL